MRKDPVVWQVARRAANSGAVERVTRSAMAGGVVARSAGRDLIGSVQSVANEALRTRRDPALAAMRRRQAARRRVQAWGLIAAGGAAWSTSLIVSLVAAGLTPAIGVFLVVALAIFGWGAAGTVRAVRDVRLRNRAVAALPPPAPARPLVASEIRPEIDRLGGYSDRLRQLVSMVGTVGTADDSPVRSTRSDVLRAADEAEARIRGAAQQLTGLLRAERKGVAVSPAMSATVASLTKQIRTGVDEYGQLVEAATEAVAASRSLEQHQGWGAGEMSEVTDRLRALAIGMRELSA